MIETRSLRAGYRGRDVLHDVSVSFPPNCVTVLLGPNGCGKSTLLRTVLGLQPAAGGEVLVDGTPLGELSPGELARRAAYLPQSRGVPNISALRMVLHGRFPYLSYPRRYRPEDYQMVQKALNWVGAGELAGRILKNADYYAAYGGGVTFSGGEPLMQAAFLGEVLRLLPGVHCAVETSGYCQPSLFQEITALLDYVIMDIKLFDETRHRHFTGVSNRLILQNALGLCEGQIPFVIRIPVIPGVNDTDENYRQTAAFLSGARNLVRVEFLPYHKTAGAKYSMAGMEYQPQFDPEGSIHISQEIFGEYGIRSVIL